MWQSQPQWKDCFSPQLLPRPCLGCGHAGHWGIYCPTLPEQGRLVSQPQVPTQWESLLNVLDLPPMTTEEPRGSCQHGVTV